MNRYLCMVALLLVAFSFRLQASDATVAFNWRTLDNVNLSETILANHHFLAFNVAEVNDKVLISWEARNIENVSYYLIQRKSANGSYMAIGGINVNRREPGNAPLDFIDQMPHLKDGVFVYRVKQVFKDGTVHYSPEKAVFHLRSQKVHSFPSGDPAYVNLEFEQQNLLPYKVELMDLSGRLVFQQRVQIGEMPVGRFRLPVFDLTRGVYIVRISDASRTLTQQVLIP